MNEETYREHLNDLQLEVEELRAKLKASQTGDTISRQAAIDAMKDVLLDEELSYAIPTLEKLPSAQPEDKCGECDVWNQYKNYPRQRWIPCSERLPDDESRSYWVCTDNGHQHECRWTNKNPFWTNLTTDWHWNIFDIPQYSKVIAWRPLPEPYTERREEWVI